MALLNSCNHVHVQPGRSPSKRGVGIQFGPNITEAFLNANGLGKCLMLAYVYTSSFSLSLSLSPHPSLSLSLSLSLLSLPLSLYLVLFLSLSLSFSLSLSLSRFANSKSWSEARWLWSCSQRQMYYCLLSSQLLVRQWCNDDIIYHVIIWPHPLTLSDQMGNKGAYITFSRDLQPEFTTYEAVVRHDCHFFTVSTWIILSLTPSFFFCPLSLSFSLSLFLPCTLSHTHTYTQPHPKVKPMQYASPLFGLLS